MRKIKTLLLLLIVTLSCCVGIDRIKALPTCDLSFYNADIEVQVSDFDLTCGDDELCAKYCPPGSLLCYDTGNVVWGSGSRNVAASLNVGDNNTIKSYGFTIYESHSDGSEPAACTVSYNINDTKPGENYSVFMNIGENKKNSNNQWIYGHIYTIHFYGTYADENGNLHNFNDDHVTVSREGQLYSSTVTPKTETSAGQTTTGLNPIDPDDPIEYSTGRGAIVKTNQVSINGQNACNSVNALFDYFWPYIMIIIPILLIIVIAIDFFKAMSSNDNDAIKKAGTNTVKRTISAVILLALPAILRLIFGLFGLDFCL